MNDQYGSMTKALFDAVTEAFKLPEDQREESLTKSFEDFQDVLSSAIADDLHAAFGFGMKGDVRRLLGTDEGEMAKFDAAPLAEFGSLMKAIQGGVDLMKSDGRFRNDIVPLIDEWVASGNALLTASISEPLSKSEDEAKLQKEQAAALREQIKTTVEALRKRAVSLVKDDTGAPPSDGSDQGDDQGDEDPDNMDPLEVIGRLAAAILVQIDALMGNDQDDGSDDQDQGQDQSATPPSPPAQKSDKTEDLKKSNDEVKNALNKVEEENKKLKEELAKFNAQPVDPKGQKKLVITDKTDDNSLNKSNDEAELKAKAEKLAKMTPQERSVELTKMALARPLKVM